LRQDDQVKNFYGNFFKKFLFYRKYFQAVVLLQPLAGQEGGHLLVAAVQAEGDFVGEFVEAAAVHTDGAAAADLRVAALGAGGRDFVTEADQEIIRQLRQGFQENLYFHRRQIVAKVGHRSGCHEIIPVSVSNTTTLSLPH